VTLELPILDQNQGPIAEAEARRKLSAAKFVELQAQIIGQIDRAAAGLRVAQEQLQTGDKLIAAEQAQQKSAEAQFQSGATDQLDMLNAQLELASTLLVQTDNAAQLQRAFGAMEDAVQSPLTLSSATIRATEDQSSNLSPK
jgi:cobalt-zinc-cadmium efflux system outer membrane protein